MEPNEQYSVKNLLFTKAIPNYVIPVPTTGHKIYACTDCGDKFLFSSSYDDHINRKSVKISYNCRHCAVVKIFYNRCNLLSHIRSHAFRTATINVSDLKLDPLPLKFFYKRGPNAAANALQKTQEIIEVNNQNEQIQNCPECKASLNRKEEENLYESRQRHYTQQTNEIHSCPLCLFTFSTTCALKSHLRFHFKLPPYICPECGMLLLNKNNNMLFLMDHKCEGFMMMRATLRLKCPVPDCHLIHPNDFKDHLKGNHLKTVYKCPFCYVACFDQEIMEKHLKTHTMNKENCLIFYQCEMCPGKLVLETQMDNHFKSHMSFNYMFPCWVCAKVFKDVFTLTAHHMDTHFMHVSVKTCIKDLLKIHKNTRSNAENKKIYRVVKRCDQCKRSFCYKCKFEQIKNLPIECPYKCTTSSGPTSSEDKLLTCHICKNKISQNWKEITKHFNEFHKAHRCVDIKINIPMIDVEKYLPIKNVKTPKNPVQKRMRRKRARRNEVNKIIGPSINTTEKQKLIANVAEFICKICMQGYDKKELLEKHLLLHRDPCMAYQCMECGQCFVVKPSFSKHLLIEHNISNIDDYIAEKHCYNESALMKYQDVVVNEPLRENQCNICREQFGNSDDLEKHFRVHGMAFLKKNNSNKTISP